MYQRKGEQQRSQTWQIRSILWVQTVQIVEAIADANVFDTGGQPVYRLCTGKRFVLYDTEVGYGIRDKALRLIEGLDRALPAYGGQHLTDQKLILPFIGRLGDALVVSSCLSALKQQYPRISVDIAAPEEARQVFELMPRTGELLSYPLTVGLVEGYDYYMSFEEIEAIPRGWNRSCADVFSACLHTPRPTAPPLPAVPEDVKKLWALKPTECPRIAVHVGLPGSLRSYPKDLLARLVGRLIDDGVDVYLLGAGSVVDRASIPDATKVHNLCGRTRTPGDLASVLEQMDAVVTGDSFPLHLAGALCIPTIALFTATDAVIGSDYPSVVTIQSKAGCSPCHVPTGACPRGHSECVAHHEHSLSPEALIERIDSLIAVVGRL